MAKLRSTKFKKELQRLLDARTYGLRKAVWPVRGAPPKLNKMTIESAIDNLCATAREELLLSPRVINLLAESYDYKKQWHAKRGKGRSRPAKSTNFKSWYDRHISTQNYVYAFWNGKECLYVGRTTSGRHRATNHFTKTWFSKASRIDIFAFDRKRDVPRYECLLTHKYNPKYSKIKPSKKKYYTRCPICVNSTAIRQEVKYIFRLRQIYQ